MEYVVVAYQILVGWIGQASNMLTLTTIRKIYIQSTLRMRLHML